MLNSTEPNQRVILYATEEKVRSEPVGSGRHRSIPVSKNVLYCIMGNEDVLKCPDMSQYVIFPSRG